MPEQFERVVAELDKALEALGDEFNAGIAGPSGLRANAIAHVRQARLILTSEKHSVPSNWIGPEPE